MIKDNPELADELEAKIMEALGSGNHPASAGTKPAKSAAKKTAGDDADEDIDIDDIDLDEADDDLDLDGIDDDFSIETNPQD